MLKKKLFDVVRDGYQCLTIPRFGRYRFEVVGASCNDGPGAQIIGEVELEKGEKITVALGQRGISYCSGNGGTFVVKENGSSDPQLLFVAAGAGYTRIDYDFSAASLSQTASGNDNIGSSGVQDLFADDENDIFTAEAGFLEGPRTGLLREDGLAPMSYKDGLDGGIGIDYDGNVTEGGFRGGGAFYVRDGYQYYGAGGGYTGGGT